MLMDNPWVTYWSRHQDTFSSGETDQVFAQYLTPYWNGVFCRFNDQENKVLDVGTGRLGLPRAALRFAKANGLPLEITATDICDLEFDDELRALTGNGRRLELIPRTSMEQLSMGNGGFDLITSQFAVEYSDVRRTLDVLFDLLKPGATMALVMHDPESDSVRGSRFWQQMITAVVDEHQLLDAAMQLVDCREAEEFPERRSRYNRAIQEIEKIIVTAGQAKIFDQIMGRMMPLLRPSELSTGDRLDGLRQLRGYLDNKLDICGLHVEAAGRTDAFIELVRAQPRLRLAHDGLISYDKGIIGRCVELQRASTA